MLYIRHMIRTQVYLPRDLYRDIDLIAKREKKAKAQEIRQIIIPTEVFSETVNVLGRNGSHQMAYGTANQILSSNPIIPETTPKIRQEALTKFKNQPESVSYTDCIVMAFADEYETREIFCFDQ